MSRLILKYIFLFFVITNAQLYFPQENDNNFKWICLQGEEANAFYTMDISKDGRYLAVGGRYKTLLYDLQRDQTILKRYNERSINTVCFSQDSKYLYSGGDGSRYYNNKPVNGYLLNIFNVTTGKLIDTIQLKNEIQDLLVSKNNKYLLVSQGFHDSKKILSIWDIAAKKRIYEFPNYEMEIDSTFFINDSLFSQENDLYEKWNLQLKRIWEINNKLESPLQIKISNNNKYIVSINTFRNIRYFGDEITVRLWDFRNDKLIDSFADYSDDPTYLAISPHNDFFSSSDRSGLITIRELKDGNLITNFQQPNSLPIYSMSFLNSDTLIFADGRGIINFLDIKNNIIVKTLDFSDNSYVGASIWGIDYSANGLKVGAGCNDGKIRLWNAANGKFIKSIDLNYSSSFVTLSPDNKYFVSIYQGSIVSIFNVNNVRHIKNIKAKIKSSIKPFNYIKSMVFTNSGRYLLIAFRRHIEVWDIKSYKYIKSLSINKGNEFYNNDARIESINISPNDSLVVAGFDGYLAAWELISGKFLGTLKDNYGIYGNGGVGYVYQIWVNNQKEVTGFCIMDNDCRTWDLKTCKVLRRTNIHPYGKAATHSPDYQFIASGHYSGLVNIWDAYTGNLLYTFDNYNSTIYDIKWSKDGKTIITGNSDGTLISWNVPNFIIKKLIGLH